MVWINLKCEFFVFCSPICNRCSKLFEYSLIPYTYTVRTALCVCVCFIYFFFICMLHYHMVILHAGLLTSYCTTCVLELISSRLIYHLLSNVSSNLLHYCYRY